MTGKLHSFQSLGTVDGPGIRCVVFLQGCPLRCICCHNPDTWEISAGETVDTDTLVSKILRYRSYFGTTGGVTVSGGEPLLQASFTAELFQKLKQAGIHTALDTSGCLLNPDVLSLLSYTDLVLLDHKYATESDYQRYTNGSLNQTERFLAELEKRHLPTWLRRVIIPGINDHPSTIASLNETAQHFSCIQKIELLPFRNLCAEKYDALNIPFALSHTPSPTPTQMTALRSLISPFYRSC